MYPQFVGVILVCQHHHSLPVQAQSVKTAAVFATQLFSREAKGRLYLVR